MSIEAISVVLHHSRSTGVARLVLIGIANHDGDGGSWPAVATLAKYAHCSDRTVQRMIRELEALGEIAVRPQRGGDLEWADNRRPNRYDLLLECPDDCSGGKHHKPRSGVTRLSPQEDVNPRPGVTSGAAWGDSPGTSGVTTVSPKPSIEPSRNHPSMERAPDAIQALADGFMDGISAIAGAGADVDRAGVAAACRSLPAGWTPAALAAWAARQNWSGAGPGAVVAKLRAAGPPPKPSARVGTPCTEHPEHQAGRCPPCERAATDGPPPAFAAARRQTPRSRTKTPAPDSGPTRTDPAPQSGTHALPRRDTA